MLNFSGFVAEALVVHAFPAAATGLLQSSSGGQNSAPSNSPPPAFPDDDDPNTTCSVKEAYRRVTPDGYKDPHKRVHTAYQHTSGAGEIITSGALIDLIVYSLAKGRHKAALAAANDWDQLAMADLLDNRNLPKVDARGSALWGPPQIDEKLLDPDIQGEIATFRKRFHSSLAAWGSLQFLPEAHQSLHVRSSSAGDPERSVQLYLGCYPLPSGPAQ